MSKSRPQQALAVVAAMLLVVTAVGGGVGAAPVGTASAQAADDPDCSTWDALIYDTMNLGDFSFGGVDDSENPCSAEYQRQQLSNEWNETDAEDTRVQIHSQAGQLAAGNEQFLTVAQNGLTNSETIAFSRGEAAAVETLANGGTISEAQQAANESIEDYFTIKQINQLDRHSTSVQTITTLNQRAENTTGVSGDFVTFSYNSQTDGLIRNSDKNTGSFKVAGSATRTVTLANGTSQTTYNLQAMYDATDGNYDTLNPRSMYFKGGNFTGGFGASSGTYVTNQIRVRSTTNLTSQSMLHSQEWWSLWTTIEDKNQQTKKEVAVYINQSLGPAVENGNLDAQNYVSAATLAQEFSQDYNGSDGYVRAMAIASSMGMSTPDLESTAGMTVIHDGETYEGMLLSQNGPENDTWESSQTYDASLISGMQFFAVQGESGEIIELDGSFTIESISDMDGNDIDSAETQQVVYHTSNASGNYTELQNQIRQLSAEIELQKERATAPPPGGGGGGGDDGWGLPSLSEVLPSTGVLAGLAAGGGVLALIGLAAGALVLGIVIRVVL